MTCDIMGIEDMWVGAGVVSGLRESEDIELAKIGRAELG